MALVLVAGDGAARADEAYARYTASGVLMFAPLYLLLCAETHAVAGRRHRAAAIVVEARALSAELGDVCRAPRLLALAEDLTAERMQGLRKR